MSKVLSCGAPDNPFTCSPRTLGNSHPIENLTSLKTVLKIYLCLMQALPSSIYYLRSEKFIPVSCLAYISVRWEGKNQHPEKMGCKSLFYIDVKFIFGPGVLHRVGISFKPVNCVFPSHLPLPTRMSSLIFESCSCSQNV